MNRFCSDLFKIEPPITIDKKDNSYKWGNPGVFDKLEDTVKDIISLIDNESLKEKVSKIVEEKKKEPKPIEKTEVVEPKSEPVEEKSKSGSTKVTVDPEKPKIIKASPVIGKSEFKEVGTASPSVYEGSKIKWTKSLIAQTLKGAERGVWYNFNDIANLIKKIRYVEISPKEVREICQEVSKQFKGIFREVDFGGVTIGSEVLVKDFINAYPQEKITETIFVRLFYGLDELQEDYPELMIKLASPITEHDNIFEVEMNRAEKTEKAFARLVYKMRPGEVVLESQNNWVFKRTKILIDKLVNL